MKEFEISVLDADFTQVCIVDRFESMIWTNRYDEPGDFELYLPASSDMLVYSIPGYYLWNRSTDKLMIIETVEIETDVENGNYLKVTGRSLESILDRRVIWEQTTVSGKIETVIKKLIEDAIISPKMSDRTISNFIFKETTDSRIAEFEIDEATFLGDSLLDAVCDICNLFSVGFEIIYNFDTSNFEFQLYLGEDRSYEQSVNPWVVYSPQFDNIISSNYLESAANMKNIALVSNDNIFVSVGSGSGLGRRELYIEGSVDDSLGSDVQAQLKQQGNEALASKDNSFVKSFESNINGTRSFEYGVDFFLGDVVQVENEYGLKGSARVTEMVISQSTSGVELYPTFTQIE